MAVYFLSDYGLTDEFVGVVHAVLTNHAPGVVVVDLTHQIPPGDVTAGARSLQRCQPFLGPAVVLAVVDPGVGTSRRALAVRSRQGSCFVGPDNGLLGLALQADGGVELAVELAPPPKSRGATFDGRDLFAPAAAALANGIALASLGTVVDPASLVLTDPAVHSWDAAVLSTEVTWVDHFGNVQLAAGRQDWDRLGEHPVLETQARRTTLVMAKAFAEIPEGRLGLLLDGNEQVAIAAFRDSAAERLGLLAGDLVRLDTGSAEA